jgi:hypothetical protein
MHRVWEGAFQKALVLLAHVDEKRLPSLDLGSDSFDR